MTDSPAVCPYLRSKNLDVSSLLKKSEWSRCSQLLSVARRDRMGISASDLAM